ncbi:dehydrogenase/reductase SDR family member 1-like [Mercenaria mercenaria]|uniref:dehydrogenase/reductase SDR family member 1-like n=1 Tax=Mercenaria mercenaria TaxID=6596 RepID=UPI00234ED8BE|nr:dehydrogenase/reductase SDR family member 1-like [Mercenaria mercenaria]
MATPFLNGKISIVTGASRGIGKGIAVQLATAGSKVYITGRTLHLQEDGRGSLAETAREIHSQGGVCVPIQCDHSKDSDTEQLFARVKEENGGQLDILVNNAFSGNDIMIKERVKSFWDHPLSMWDDINNVGLRNVYLCSIYGSRLMVPRKSGIIINISSAGGSMCMFNPAYGIGKAGVDRMAADCALELKKHNVAFVSLLPGPVSSETVFTLIKAAKDRGENVQDYKSVVEKAETPDFVGKCVVSLTSDPSIMEKTGKALPTFELAKEYGIKDEQGHGPVTDSKEVLLNFVQGHII